MRAALQTGVVLAGLPNKSLQDTIAALPVLTINPETAPADHPLWAIKRQTDAILAPAYCSNDGRPSNPPEQLRKVLLLQVLHTIRSEI